MITYRILLVIKHQCSALITAVFKSPQNSNVWPERSNSSESSQPIYTDDERNQLQILNFWPLGLYANSCEDTALNQSAIATFFWRPKNEDGMQSRHFQRISTIPTTQQGVPIIEM